IFLLQTLHRLSVAGSQPGSSAGAGLPEPATEAAEPPAPAGPLDPLENRVLSGHVKTVFRLWVIVFGLVGAQIGWGLRPFVGNPALPFTWFRGRESNFFQAVFQTLGRLLSS